MTAREFLTTYAAVIDRVHLDHEAGVLNGIFRCHCTFRGTEAEWHQHLGRQIANAIDGADDIVIQLPLEAATA